MTAEIAAPSLTMGVPDIILPERKVLSDLHRKVASFLTVPSADGTWKPTYKYTLRGMVSEPNTVYQRIRGPLGEVESTVAENGSPVAEDRWWRISYKDDEGIVQHTVSVRSLF